MFSRWFRKSNPPAEAPRPAAVYTGLRGQILNLKPDDLDLRPAQRAGVWGALMEMGYAHGSASLVALADGTASLYFSNGGGILGGGQHKEVAQAARDFLSAVQIARPAFQFTRETPLPLVGQVRFYALTTKGVYTAFAPEDDLGHNRLPLAELFYAGQQVITQLREHDRPGRA